jgi:transposase InsO family protein
VIFATIAAERAHYPVQVLCRTLGVSPSGFYASRTRPESRRRQEDRRLKVLLHASFTGGRGFYGSPRIHDDFKEWGEHVSRKRIIRLKREERLVARVRKRYKVTTDSDHNQPIADNLLRQDFSADRPNQRWVGDTSELRIGESAKAYLAVIVDLFSRFVVGWAISAVNDRHLTIKALEMALKRRCPGAGLLHHSDQGSTYASEDYREVLATHGVTCSMSRRGNCYDNAVMEAFFSTVKNEVGERFPTHADAKAELFDYLEVFYNQRRRHSSAGRMSPAAYERKMGYAA